MARMIDQRSFEDNSALRVLREGAARATPLFTVNSTANYFAMATLMETDQPIYNLNMFGLTNSLSDRLDSVTIPEIASLMAQEIRDAHPDGPYQFLAFCQDGPIALELARIFRDDGIEVSSLLLIDCMFKPVERSTNRTLRNALRMGFPFVKAKLRRIVARATRKDRFADMVPERRLALMEKSKSDAMLYRRFVDLFQGYVPAEYDSPVFLFLSREWLGSDLSVVKGISTNGFEVYRLSGLHNSLFDPGSVGELASNVGTALGKVSGR
jgi:thioesterase domain-containing protein